MRYGSCGVDIGHASCQLNSHTFLSLKVGVHGDAPLACINARRGPENPGDSEGRRKNMVRDHRANPSTGEPDGETSSACFKARWANL